jgi:hypothetical protein
MRPIDSESWNLLVEAGRSCPGLPEELRSVLAVPYAELVPLPWGDASRPASDAGRRLPTWREHSFDGSYLDFLDEQIRAEARGPEGSQRLRARRAALAPFVDRVLVGYRIYWNGFDASIKVDPGAARVVHFEVDRTEEGGSGPA